MGKVLCRMLAIIVLVGALVNFTTLLRTSPAFNGAERMESVLGGWRVPNVAFHYDKAEYQLELAYGYLNELGLTFDPETEKMVMIDADEMNARTSKALEHIDASLRLDPANASAWVYLAQAHSRNNDIDAMRDSLERSWKLAPNNLYLAALRLMQSFAPFWETLMMEGPTVERSRTGACTKRYIGVSGQDADSEHQPFRGLCRWVQNSYRACRVGGICSRQRHGQSRFF